MCIITAKPFNQSAATVIIALNRINATKNIAPITNVKNVFTVEKNENAIWQEKPDMMFAISVSRSIQIGVTVVTALFAKVGIQVAAIFVTNNYIARSP